MFDGSNTQCQEYIMAICSGFKQCEKFRLDSDPGKIAPPIVDVILDDAFDDLVKFIDRKPQKQKNYYNPYMKKKQSKFDDFVKSEELNKLEDSSDADD